MRDQILNFFVEAKESYKQARSRSKLRKGSFFNHHTTYMILTYMIWNYDIADYYDTYMIFVL